MPAAALALTVAACTPATQYVYLAGPQPAPCTDTVAARVDRTPAESVTVADREHALWAHEQCQAALAAQADSARRAAVRAASGRGPKEVWPPPACSDSIAARVARMSADSVSAADREHAAAARLACERALAAPPPPATNPASLSNPRTWAVVAGVVILTLILAF